MELEHELDALFAAPLDDFVRLRNERAAALRKEGHRAAAAALKEQAKPTVTAWAVNQVVRRRRAEADELLAVGERLRSAHEAALTGAGKQEFDEARRAERDFVARLVREAEQVLRESGHATTPAARERISRTLRSAPADPEGRELLAKGRFVSDFEPTGFEALAGLRLPARGPARREPPKKPTAPAPSREQATEPARREEARRGREAERRARAALADARARERELGRRLRDAERRAEQARAAADRAEKELEALRREAADAAEAAAAAEQELAAARGGPGR